jgi:acetyl/propionyl-CoA carboxylase alpha subunit
MGKDLATAMAHMAAAAASDLESAFKTANYVLEAGEARERRALVSISDFAEGVGVAERAGNIACVEQLLISENETEHEILVHYDKQATSLQINDNKISASGILGDDGALSADLDGTRTHVTVVEDDAALTILHSGFSYQLTIVNKSDHGGDEEAIPGTLTSPMPGKVIEMLVAIGDEVKKGAPLVILEAMKMEHTINAPVDGVVSAVHYAAGDMLDEGVELLVIEGY